MNRISAIALLSFASLATCTGAIGQEHALQANIPFAFTVGDTWMPAGEYTITSLSQGILMLRSADSTKSASIVSLQGHSESPSGSELVFDRYGNQYFLRHVLCPTLVSLNRDLPQGKAEKQAHARSLEANVRNPEQTLIAARYGR
jgi:hypothetical protein